MSDVIHRGVIEVEVNDSGVDAGIASIERKVENLGKIAQATGKTASDGIEKIGSGGDVAAGKVDAATKNMIGSIQRTTSALEAGSKSSSQYYAALASKRGVDVDALKPYLAQLDAVSAKQKNYGKSANEMAFAMRGLPAQFTDIAVSLQGGQRPLSVLLQQGGQLKDMFGGIGPAAKAMGSYVAGLVNPFTIGAAVIGAFAYAAYSGAEEAARLNNALIATGGYSGKSTVEISGLVKEVGGLTGNLSGAKEAAERLTLSGVITGDNMKAAMQGVTDGARVTGKTIEEMVAIYVSIAKDPVQGVKALDDQFHLLSSTQTKHIGELAKVGDQTTAVTTTINDMAAALRGKSSEMVENLGVIEQAAKAVKDSFVGIWEEMKNIGKYTPQNDYATRLKESEAYLKSMENGTGEFFDKERALVAANIKIYRDMAKVKADSAAGVVGDSKKKVNLEFADKYVDSNKRQDRSAALDKENDDYKRALSAYAKGTDDYQKVVAAHKQAVEQINKKYEDKKAIKAINQEQTAYASLISSIGSKIEANKLEAAAGIDATESQKLQIKFDEDLKTGKLKLTAAHKAVAQEKLNELAVGETENRQKRASLEYDIQYQRSMRDMVSSYKLEIDTMGLSSEAAEKLAVSTNILAKAEDNILSLRKKKSSTPELESTISQDAQKQIDVANQSISAKYAKSKDPWYNYTDSVRTYGEEASNVGKQIGETMTNAMKSAEDAWVSFATTGKVSFSSLATSVVADIARIQAKNLIASAASGTSSILGSLLGSSGMLDSSDGTPYYLLNRNAKGNVFSGSSSLSAYSNSIVSSPTMFAFAKGAGLMGEAGPEAIIPLTRGSDGNLGVRSNGSGGNTSVVVNNNSSNSQATAKQTTDSRGNRRVEVVVGDLNAGEIRRPGSATNSAYRQTFGARTALVGR